MLDCGSQCYLCALPIRFDNYSWCSHGCKYCFVQRKVDISEIKKGWGIQQLKNFIEGKRTLKTNWCDRQIPLHWGGVSDPFQPIEKELGITKQALEVFAKSQYPFVVSTKGRLIADDEYLNLLSKCNCVVQISLVAPEYNKLEPWCPSFEERLAIIKKVAPRVKRLIVRCQPYTPEVKASILRQLPEYKKAWVYGVIFEWIKMFKKVQGLVKLGGDFVIPKAKLQRDFMELKAKCHELGLKFYAGENRLRQMGDDLCCCWIDGLGRKPNTYNLNYFLYDKEKFKPTKAMHKQGTAQSFTTLFQNSIAGKALEKESFKGMIDICCKDKSKLDTFLSKD